MKNRCNNAKDQRHFQRYGAKGIKVCNRWDKYENFLADMGRAPAQDYSIDRKDNKKGYSPENCKWATLIEQANNTSKCYQIGADNLTLSGWAQKLKVNMKTLWGWLYRDLKKVDKNLGQTRLEKIIKERRYVNL